MKLCSILMCLLLWASTISCRADKEDQQAEEPRPNILLIVADDLGYSDIAPFGGEISTPTLSKLGEEGVVLTNFHVLPTCSPSRSVLLSGTDNHVAGLGCMEEFLTEKQEGKPGYEGYLNNRVAHLPQLLRESGYLTYMSGKWHLGLEEDHRPDRKGFDESFALLQGGGSHWADKRPLSPTHSMTYVNNGKPVEQLPEDFYSSKYYTDILLEWLDRDKEKDNPFFAYLAFTAPHDPLHAPAEYIKRYKGRYDAGFGELREERFESLKKLGIISDSVHLPLMQGKNWSQFPEEVRKEMARDMEVYAAMIEYMDDQIARVFDWLEQNGELDNTMIVFFSDNGANGALKTSYPGQTEAFLNSFDNSMSNRGLPGSFIEMGPLWATASMSPHRLFKGFTTEGGIISPCIIKLPGSSEEKFSIETFTHLADIMPTFLQVAKVDHPSKTDDSVPGMIGKSLLPLLKGQSTEVHHKNGIGYELHGLRAYIRGDWKILNLPKPFGKGDWALFNLAKDPSESVDLSMEYPEIRNELIEAWKEYSENSGVVFDPLDVQSILKPK